MRYQARLVRVLEHLLGGRHLAEDVAQEVFLRVFRRETAMCRKPSSPPGSSPSPTTRPPTPAHRSRRREVTLAAGESGSTGVATLGRLVEASSGSMPARQLDKAEMRQVVRWALEGLAERQRAAVLLNKFEGMSYADIAAALELSPQAVKSLLSRARENLRQILEPYLQTGATPDISNAG